MVFSPFLLFVLRFVYSTLFGVEVKEKLKIFL